MKAVVCTKYGQTADVVELRDMPKPGAGPNEVLIEVHAASLNPVDFKIQQGALKAIRKLSFPYIMGLDVSGVVVAVGAGVRQFKVGDEVFSRVGGEYMGSFAEFINVDEKYVAAKPSNISHQEAAALPLVALTTWQVLVSTANLQPGQRVLIHAGAGGIGSIAIQIAKVLGATVIATTSTKNLVMVKALGADQVIDYKVQAFEKVVKDVDVVYETLGGENQAKSFQVLKAGGILVSIVGIPSSAWAREEGLPVYMGWLFDLLNWKNRRLARQQHARFAPVLLQPEGSKLAIIAEMAASRKIHAVIDRVFPLEQTKEALLYIQSGRATGKIVISVK